jgi:hypothetical protein
MAAKIVKSWRGVIRGQLHKAVKTLQSIINYNVEHASVGFLTNQMVIDIQQAKGDCQALLNATKPR